MSGHNDPGSTGSDDQIAVVLVDTGWDRQCVGDVHSHGHAGGGDTGGSVVVPQGELLN